MDWTVTLGQRTMMNPMNALHLMASCSVLWCDLRYPKGFLMEALQLAVFLHHSLTYLCAVHFILM